jgi:hypothetical protein
VQKDKYPQLETPIEVVDVKVNDKALDANESVLAGEDWLKRFKVHFRNKTGKSIIYLRAVLEVAQQGNMRYMLRLPLYFGKMPEPPGSQVGVKAKKPVNMLEDEGAATLNVTDEEYKFFLRQMQENQITDVNRVALVFEFIVFADDTAWSMGHLMRRDPKNPAGWKVVGVWEKDPTEFKAHPSSIASQPCRSISQQEASPPKRAILWRRWNLRGVEAGKENSPAFFAASFFNFIVQDPVPGAPCIYLEGELPQPCSLSNCESEAFCITQDPVQTLTRNAPEFYSPGGTVVNISVNCRSLNPSCTCSQPSKLVQAWRPPPIPCRNSPCTLSCSSGYTLDNINCACNCNRPAGPGGLAQTCALPF